MNLGKVRFFPYHPQSPYENMAIDEFLLTDCIERGTASFRLYGWTPPGLSIGLNQKIDTVRVDRCREEGLALVRRMTGGGAILHGDELTYSLAVPREAVGLSASIRESFEAISKFLMLSYARLGLEARYAKDVFPEARHGSRAPFCFTSSEEYDIIIDNKKIGGNAQSRKKTAIFQHGSIPLGPSEGESYTLCEPGDLAYTSLGELCGRGVSPREIADICTAAFAQSFNAELVASEFTIDEKRRIVGIMRSKYCDNNWNYYGRL